MTNSAPHPKSTTATTGLTLVVLAAGVGSRYGGLKQLEPVGPAGETLLEYSIFDALRAGFDHIVLVIRRETEDEFRKSIESRLTERVGVSYIYQELADLPDSEAIPSQRVKPWGTAHAVLAVEPAVSGPFAVINADDFYGRDSFRALADFLSSDSTNDPPTFALAGFEVGPTLSEAGPVSRGLCFADRHDWLERIVEIPKLAKKKSGACYTDETGNERSVSSGDLVSMNMWGFTTKIFPWLRSQFREFLDDLDPNTQDEFLIPDAIHAMIADESARVRVLRHSGRWCGITFPEDRRSARAFIAALIKQGEYPPRLWD